MRTTKGMAQAARDFLLQGNQLTRLEALVFFGISDLPNVVSDMRAEGWLIRSKRIPYARALRRINQECKLEVPKSLPIKEITLLQYWVER